MKLQEIYDMYERDTDETKLADLTREIGKAQPLHCKYNILYSYAIRELHELDEEFYILYLLKKRYYVDGLSQEELKEQGWEAYSFRVMKTEADTYIRADKDIIALERKRHIAKEKVRFLDEALGRMRFREKNLNGYLDSKKYFSGN